MCVVVDEGPKECSVVDAVVVAVADDSDANCGSFVDAADTVAEANVAVFVAAEDRSTNHQPIINIRIR